MDALVRGLNVRIAYEKECLALLAGKEVDNEAVVLLRQRAGEEGMQHFQEGQRRPPALFLGCDDLEKCWRDGFHFMEKLAEMADCDGCTDGRGDPCPFHG